MDSFYDYDFSLLDADEIKNEGSDFAEIISVCESNTTRLREIEGYPRKLCYCIAIGYSSKKRIIQVAFRYPEYKIQILQVGRPDEDQIDRYYCNE